MKKISYLTLTLFLVSLFLPQAVRAASLEYALVPKQIAEDTWMLEGSLEDFSRENGGNIVNTVFIVTKTGVVVFDTGPSKRYGESMRQAIAGVTSKPITHVFISHHHPDHFLGNQAFADVPIYALPNTIKKIAESGSDFAENMYRLVGDWMRGTEVVLPNTPLTQTAMEIGGHQFEFIPMSGHTNADLVLFDKTTGVLVAADIIFFKRALTTPHTPGLDVWMKDVTSLAALPHKTVVPGHGPVDRQGDSFVEMLAYLQWLDSTLRSAAEQGLSMTEVMALPIDPRFLSIALTRNEFIRSVSHLYPSYEASAF